MLSRKFSKCCSILSTSSMRKHAPLGLTRVELQLEHGLFRLETIFRLLFESCTNAGAEHGFLSSMGNMLRLLSLKVNNSLSIVSDSNVKNVQSIQFYAMYAVMRTTARARVLLAIYNKNAQDFFKKLNKSKAWSLLVI